MIVFSHRLLAIEIRLVSLWGAQKKLSNAGCGGPAIKASTKHIQTRSSLIIWILQMPETMSKTISSRQTEA